MTTALHTRAAFRLAPLALCLVLAACGGSSSSRGQLGTLDPVPIPFTEDFAPLAAKLATTQAETVARSYRNTLGSLDDIRIECANFLTETDTQLEVRNCAMNQQAGSSYYGRDTRILITYQEDDATPDQVAIDIRHFEDDVLQMSSGLQQQTRTRIEGSFTLLPGSSDEVLLADTNGSFTLHHTTQVQGNLPIVSLTYFLLQDYHLDASPDTDPARYAQDGRVIVSVGGVLGYVDIITDSPLEIRDGEDCPFIGEVSVLGRDDDEMIITFQEDDITVVINGTSEAYSCDTFRAWIDPA